MLIDEWAGAINAGKIKKSQLGYLHELAARLDSNQFSCHYVDPIVRARFVRQQAANDSKWAMVRIQVKKVSKKLLPSHIEYNILPSRIVSESLWRATHGYG